jgi:hypothetical protein
VARDFTAERPGEKMVGDITYIPTSWIQPVVATPTFIKVRVQILNDQVDLDGVSASGVFV